MGLLSCITGLLVGASVAIAGVIKIPLHNRASQVTNGDTRFRVGRATGGYQVPIKDWFNRTDNQWYATIGVGTPPQNLSVLFDTGSSALLLPGSDCTTCGSHKLFNSARSSSFSSSPGTRTNPLFSTGADSIPFTEPQGASGLNIHDTITLGPLVVKSQAFVLCDKYAAALDGMPIDGIMGMGPYSSSSTAWYWSLYNSGQLDGPEFSFYTPPGHIDGGELTLGGIDTTKYTGALTYTKFKSVSQGFTLAQSGLYINDKIFSKTGEAILDTGTAFMQTPDYATAKKLYAAISSEITQIDSAGAWGAPCATLEAIAPNITLRLGPSGSTIDLTIPASSFNLGEYPGKAGICQALFNNPLQSFGDGVWLVGSPLLKQYYTVWNAVKSEIGWAKPVPAV